MKIKDVLKQKSGTIFTINQEKTIFEGMSTIVPNKIGSLIVTDDQGKIVGIFSERDALRECYNNPDSFRDIKIKDVMTKSIIVAEPEDEVDYVLGVMTQNKFRHTPIVNKNGELVGIVSIGDLVKVQLSEKDFENKYLMQYIQG